MHIVGSSPTLAAKFFPDGFVTQILDFVLKAWSTLQPTPKKTDKEEAITGRLYEHMRDRAPENLPLFIIPEGPLYDGATGKVLGRTDFRFLHRGMSDRIYLVVEAKRLRIPKSRKRLFRNTAAYCGIEGMCRFISGKYSSGLPEAAMLGYVMDGDITAASQEVVNFCEKIRNRIHPVHKPALGTHPYFPVPAAHSEHNRAPKHGGRIILHHLFVPV